MPRRLVLVCLALLLAAGSARAQVSFGNDAIPTRRALSRVNLDIQFVGVVPLIGAEKLIEMSIDEGMLFAQTNSGHFHAYDAESGRFLWTASLGQVTSHAQPASVNSQAVFVTNSNRLFALDRKTGRLIWSKELPGIPSSDTSADETHVMVGLVSGKLMTLDTKTGADRWNIQTNQKISSRPIMAGRVAAFASEDKKIYLSNIERPKLYWRFAAGAPITAPLGAHGVRTLLVPSSDKNLYAIDLFSGESRWTFGSGAPLSQEPIVSRDEVFIVNDEGLLLAIDAKTGLPLWTVSTLGGRLISVSSSKVYLESHDDDLFVVDRKTGKVLYDPATTFQRAGINLRGYSLGPTNRLDDRLYFGTTHGLLLCLREVGQVKPFMLREPGSKPFGYIPPEGYPETPVPAVVPPPAEGSTPPPDGSDSSPR